MILLDSFKRINLPTPGTLYSEQVLPWDIFNELKTITFKNGVATKPTNGKRVAFEMWAGKKIPKNATLGDHKFRELLRALDNIDVIKELCRRSAESAGQPLETFWNGGLSLEELNDSYVGVHAFSFRDVEGLTYNPHIDYAPGLQLYVNPDYCPNLGTTFHRADDFSDSVTLPFKANTGYFQLNTPSSFHSIVHNAPGIVRDSILFSWIFMFKNKQNKLNPR